MTSPRGSNPSIWMRREDAEPAAPEDPAAKPKARKPKAKRPENPSESDLAGLEAVSWESVKSEVDALRQRIAGMGAVNLVAIEEYAELKQRHDFLKSEPERGPDEGPDRTHGGHRRDQPDIAEAVRSDV